MSDVSNRIIGHAEVDPNQLLANPLNFRRHPGRQMDALRGSLKELGWIKTVIVNQRTGYVIDGHARVEEAIRQGAATVPVTYVDLSEDDERKALAVLDPITGQAYHDDEVLRDLLGQVQPTTDDAGLSALFDELLGAAKTPDPTLLDPTMGLDDSGAAVRVTNLKWGDAEVPLTTDEKRALDRLLVKYADESGSHFGFAAWLTGQCST